MGQAKLPLRLVFMEEGEAFESKGSGCPLSVESVRCNVHRRRRKRISRALLPTPPTELSEEGEEERGGSGEGEVGERGGEVSCDSREPSPDLLTSPPMTSWTEAAEEEEEDDLLTGICPEDFSFSLNTSHTATVHQRGGGSVEGDVRVEGGGGSVEGGGGMDEETGTFFGLPSLVQSLLEEHRGIHQLYGNG